VSYLLRVVLPDRPGMLGAVATALGEAGADIVSLDVVERGPDGAVDDLLVELPPGALVDRLISGAQSVPGVVVESLRPYTGAADLHRDLELVEALAAAGEEALQVLVEHANAGRLVVRLKGGDPFIFGRGAEEMAACRDAGIEVTVIPGVSSAFAVPLAAGIPVTHRRMARQVTVLTGHDEDGMIRANWPALATGDGTLVVLMGVAALPTMTDELLCHGMDPGIPVAVIERGCSAAQRVTVGRLCTIADLARRRGVVSPAVIVIGAVASFARDTEIPTRDGEIPTHDRRSAI